jgi:hypothetical protein
MCVRAACICARTAVCVRTCVRVCVCVQRVCVRARLCACVHACACVQRIHVRARLCVCSVYMCAHGYVRACMCARKAVCGRAARRPRMRVRRTHLVHYTASSTHVYSCNCARVPWHTHTTHTHTHTHTHTQARANIMTAPPSRPPLSVSFTVAHRRNRPYE